MNKTLKQIKSPLAIERAYIKRLKQLSTDINKSVLWWANARLHKNISKNIGNQLAFEFNALLDEWDKKTNEVAKTLAKKISKQVKNYVDLNLNSQNPEFKLKSVTKQSKNALSAIYQNNLALIKTIPSEIIERYRSAYLNNVNNFDREQIYRLAKTYQGISNRRAKTIARDQTQKAVSNFTQARAEQLGFEYYEWVTAGDERVSKDHQHLNGRVYRYDTPTAKIDSYGNVGHPSQRVNCLAKGQGVDFGYFPRRLFRFSSFDKFAVLTLRDGSIWVVTRNHKVLTHNGWRNAETLKKGDEVILISQKSGNISEINLTHNKPIISKIFDFFDKVISPSLCDTLGFKRVGSAGDFDADIRADENVDIIDMYSLLERGREFIISQILENFNFTSSEMRISFKKLLSRVLSLDSPSNPFVLSVFFTSERYVGLFSDSFSFFESAIFKSDNIGFTSRSSFITEFINSFGDNASRNPEILTHFKNAITSKVELFNFFYIYIYIVWWFRTESFVSNPHFTKKPSDTALSSGEFLSDLLDSHSTSIKIIDSVEIVDINSHIYSLETNCGYYTINNTIHKNCRCIAVSVIMDNKKAYKVKDGKYGDYYVIK